MNNDSLANLFEIPSSAAPGSAKIEIYSNKQIIIDGCHSVIEYSENAVNINCGKKTVIFLGSDLKIVSYFDKGLVLQGNIASIQFGA